MVLSMMQDFFRCEQNSLFAPIVLIFCFVSSLWTWIINCNLWNHRTRKQGVVEPLGLEYFKRAERATEKSTSLHNHYGPITGIHFQHFHGVANQSGVDLLLTSSFDWTVKLWSPKVRLNNFFFFFKKEKKKINMKIFIIFVLWNQRCKVPLYSFDSSKDYVMDVQW